MSEGKIFARQSPGALWQLENTAFRLPVFQLP